MTQPESSLSQPPEQTSAEVENQHHRYTGNRIPWYVRLLWLGFWIFAVVYVILYFFPSIQVELFQNR